jgi:hypothetical protein
MILVRLKTVKICVLQYNSRASVFYFFCFLSQNLSSLAWLGLTQAKPIQASQAKLVGAEVWHKVRLQSEAGGITSKVAVNYRRTSFSAIPRKICNPINLLWEARD